MIINRIEYLLGVDVPKTNVGEPVLVEASWGEPLEPRKRVLKPSEKKCARK